jgi:uncharacterized RDD family membrane protein YckC
MFSKPQEGIATIWKRLLAFVIDYCLLISVTLLMGKILNLDFFEVGNMAYVFIVFLLYLGVFNSDLGKGQTLGEKLLAIKVVTINGKYLNFPKSILRASLYLITLFDSHLLTMFLLYGQPSLTTRMLLSGLGSLAMMLLGIYVYYLIPFNPYRRGLPDYLAGSLVVNSKSSINTTDSLTNFIASNKIKLTLIHIVIIGLAFYTINVMNSALKFSIGSSAKQADKYLYEKFVYKNSEIYSVSVGQVTFNAAPNKTWVIRWGVSKQLLANDSKLDELAKQTQAYLKTLKDPTCNGLTVAFVQLSDYGMFNSTQQKSFNLPLTSSL